MCCSSKTVRQQAGRFDVLHFHTDYLHFPLFRDHAHCTVTTLHGRLDLPELLPLFREFGDIPLVSISNAQRWPLPTSAGSALSTTGCRSTCCAFEPGRGATTSPFSGASHPRSGSTAPSRSRPPAGFRCRSRPRSIRLTRSTSNSRFVRCSIIRSSSSSARSTSGEGPVSRGRAGAALPDRLAGAVRPRADRIAGLRDAGGGVPWRIGRRRSSTPASQDSSSSASTMRSKR